MTEKNRVKILGVPVDMVDRGQAMQIFEESESSYLQQTSLSLTGWALYTLQR